MSLLLLTIPAGMPSFTLNDMTALRLQSISFFVVAFLLAAWGIKGVSPFVRSSSLRDAHAR